MVNLYRAISYELARSRLQPGGLFAQWLPLAHAERRRLPRAGAQLP
ncbi:hypothetical protein ACU4GD_07750 [Cupriavidus basilensis]